VPVAAPVKLTIRQKVIRSLELDLKQSDESKFPMSAAARRKVQAQLDQLKAEEAGKAPVKKKDGWSREDIMEDAHNQHQAGVDDWYANKKKQIAEEEAVLSTGSENLETGAPEGDPGVGPTPISVEEVMALPVEEFTRWFITHGLISGNETGLNQRPYIGGRSPADLRAVVNRIKLGKTHKKDGTILKSVADFYADMAEIQKNNDEFPMIKGTGGKNDGRTGSPPLSAIIQSGLDMAKGGPVDEVDEDSKEEVTPKPRNKNYLQGALKSVIDGVVKAFNAHAPSWMTTSGNETGYNVGEVSARIPTAASKAAYAAQRTILRLMEDGNIQDSKDLKVNGRTGVFLTAKFADGRIRMTLTDKNGDAILFDGNDQPALDGNPREYGMRAVDKFFDKEGNVKTTGKRFNEMVDALINAKPHLTRTRAVNILKAEVEHIQAVREYINKDQENNSLEFSISGGSLGYIQVGFSPKELTSVSKLSDKVTMKLSTKADNIGEEGHVYATSDEMEGDWIPIERPGLRDTPFADVVESLLFDENLTDKDGKLLNAVDRAKHIDKYVGTNKESEILFDYDIGTKKVKRLVIGNTVIIDVEKGIRDLEVGKIAYKQLLAKNNKGTSFPTLKMHVNADALARRDFMSVSIADGVVTTEGKNTRVHMAEQGFMIQTPDVASDGMIRKVNAYFTFKLSEKGDQALNGKAVAEEEAKIAEQNTEEIEENEDDAWQKAMDAKMKALQDKNKPLDEDEDDRLFRSLDVKNQNRAATAEQIKEARDWYEKHPLSKHIPFKTMFEQMNKDGVAQWTVEGITLFKGADYSDLYHEAWHGFTQTMLTKQQKTDLYKELGRKVGSFKDYNGRMVSFAAANEKQLEEHLAEEFRSFMLKGKKATTAGPKQLSFFKKILAILKALFNNSHIDQVIMDAKFDSKVSELFEKMRVGNLAGYTFSQANANFGKLNQGITAIPGNEIKEGVESLNYQTSAELNNMMDAYLAEYVTVMNQGLDSAGQARVKKLNTELQDTENLNQAEQKAKRDELDALLNNDAASYKYSSLIVSDPDVLTTGYFYAQGKFQRLKASLSAKVKKETDPVQKASDLKDLKMIEFALDQFGNIDDIYSNQSADGTVAYGLIGYHMQRSKLFQDSRPTQEEIADEQKGPVAKRAFDRAGNESSLKEMASAEILYLLKTLPQVEKNDEGEWVPVTNRFDVNELAPFQTTWNRMVRATENIQDFDQMYDKLQEEAVKFPVLEELLKRMGDPHSSKVNTEHTLWTQLFKTFSKSRVPLIQMTVEQQGRGVNVKWEARVGEAFNADYAIGRQWQSMFTGAEPSEFIKNTIEGNYMDLAAIIKKFPHHSAASANPFEFFHAIGMPLSDNPEIRNELKANLGTYGPGHFHDEIMKLKGAGTRVERLDQITEEVNGRYKDLMKLEARYSDVFSSFMVTNAEGNTQFEHTLNNSMTMMVNAVNNSIDYNDMVSKPHLAHLDINKNPFAKSSLWLKAMFNLDGSPDINSIGKDGKSNHNPNYGERRVTKSGDFVTLRLTNLSGVLAKTMGDETGTGVSSAGADEYSKLIMDLQLSYSGMPELMRHADKGTSFTITIDGPLDIDSQPTDNYVPIGDFAAGGRFREKTVDRLSPHIVAEMSRMRILRGMTNMDGTPKMDVPFDVDYIMNGQQFVAFEDVLSDGTKAALKKIAFSEENIEDAVEAMRETINADLTKYFDKQYEEVNKKFDDAFFLADNIQEDMSRKGITGNKREAAIRSYVHNSWIHNIESIAVIYGDLAQYNHAKEGFHKRNAGGGSTGDIYRYDKTMAKNINDNYYKSSYAAKHANRLGITERRYFGGTMSTAIIEDQEIRSVYMDEYEEAFGEDAYKLGNYAKQNEGDAQGLITFDSYRELKVAEGTWSNEQDALFKKIVNGEKVSSRDVAQFFPVIKAQYWGPLANDTALPVMAFHKYSLFPMTPSVIKGKKMEKLHDKMVKEGIGYVTFESGSKVGTISKTAKVKKNEKTGEIEKVSRGYDKVYTEGEALDPNIMDPKMEDADGNYVEHFTKNDIHLHYLKNQLEIHDERKGNVIFSTQLRKLIEDGLMANGVPSDFMMKESLGGSKVVAERKAEWAKIEAKWDTMSPEAQQKTSKKYGLLKDYEKNINRLTQYAKEKLLEEINWQEIVDPKTGEKSLKGDMKNLLELVRSELVRQDLGQHSIDFIQTNTDGTIKHDLSLSLNVEQIEKLLNAMMVKKLIKQKVNGEGLIQVAATLMEDMAAEQGRDFRNPTEEDLAKWGSKDLPHYRPNQGPNGETTAAKVKVALAGDFRHLLKMTSVQELAKEQRIIDIAKAKGGSWTAAHVALNELIKDEEWLNEGRNREMVSMIGVRIPVQGLNSMEFMEVYEFLPEEAGSVIVPPTEIVTKSGADFDVDKMTVMMPNILSLNGSVELATSDLATKPKETLKEERDALVQKISDIREEHKEARKDKETRFTAEEREILDDTKSRIRDEQRKIKSLKKQWLDTSRQYKSPRVIKRMKALEESIDAAQFKKMSLEETEDMYYNTLPGDRLKHILSEPQAELAIIRRQLASLTDKPIQNDIMNSIRAVLELPDNFKPLVMPNSTELLTGQDNDGLAQEMEPHVVDTNKFDNVHSTKRYQGPKGDRISATRVLEVGYNLEKHMKNAIGKQTLALGAVDNTYNTLFNRIGAYMNPRVHSEAQYDAARRQEKKDKKKLTQKQKDVLKEYSEQRIMLNHNTMDIEGSDAISLSHINDAAGTPISDVVNQLINGWVDIAADAFVFNLQGNKEISPVLLFMVQAGVPIDEAVYFVSNPLVREYVKEQKLANSTFGMALGTTPTIDVVDAEGNSRVVPAPQMAQFKSKGRVLSRHFQGVTDGTQRTINELGRERQANANDYKGRTKFDKEELKKAAKSKMGAREITEFDKDVFVHFLEIENMSKAVKDMKMRTNVDTSKDATLFEAQDRITMIEQIKRDGKFPAEMVDKIRVDSPIASFFIQDFQIDLLGDAFPLRNHEVINNFIQGVEFDDWKNTYGLKDKAIINWKSDMINYIFQNELKYFDVDKITHYKGRRLTSRTAAQATSKVNLGTETAPKSGNVIIDAVKGREPQPGAITAFRTKGKTEQNMIDALKDDAVGNPFGPYGAIKEETAVSVTRFLDWLEGKADTNVMQDYRNAILAKQNELANKDIYYYKDLSRPSHATALDYFLNKSTQQTSDAGMAVEDVFLTRHGAYAKDGKMYIDKAQLKTDFANKTYTQKPITQEEYAKETHEAVSQGETPTHMRLTAPVSNLAFSTENEYIQFVMERESLREARPLSKLLSSEKDWSESNSKFKAVVDRFMYENKIKVGQSKDAHAEWVVAMAYEVYLRDVALARTNNHWHMFRGEDTYAHEFARIKRNYPVLSTHFSLMNALDFKGSMGWKNLALNQSELDGDQTNVLHENLQDLADSSKLQELLPEASQMEIDEIKEHFENFHTVAFLQSGMSQGSRFSMTQFVSQDQMIRLMEKPLQNLNTLLASNNPLKQVFLEEYHHRWVQQNSAASRNTRIRGKNMNNNVTLLDSNTIGQGVQTTEPAQQRITTIGAQPALISERGYSGFNISQTNAEKYLEKYPNFTFVYDFAIDNQMGAAGANSNRNFHGKGPNAIGLPTLFKYSPGNDKTGTRPDLIRDVDGKVSDKVKEVIDHAIDQMVDNMNSGQTLQFDREGYGQYMIESKDGAPRLAPQTFLYLSKQLLERVQFVNPGYLKTQSGKVATQAGQAVTDASIWQEVQNEMSDDAVRDFIKQCL